jgi:hypothetical protein
VEPRRFQHRGLHQLTVLASTGVCASVPGPGGGASGVYRLVSLAAAVLRATGFSLRSLRPFKIFFLDAEIGGSGFAGSFL